LRSNELSTAPNVIDSATATANFYTSPDGTTNAIKLTETTANATHGFYQYYTVSAQTYTVSIFTKQIGRRYICLTSNFTGTNAFSYFDLQNKVVVSSGAGYTCSIQEFSDGWLRLSATVTASSGFRYTVWGGSANGTTNTYVGNTSTFMAFYGLQLEAGAYATSYIPTTSASVTRNADVISKTGISSLIGQTEGTIFFDGVINGCQNTSANLLNSERNTTASFYISYVKASSQITAGLYSSGTQPATFSGGSVAIGDRVKIAYAYKSGNSALYVNGILIGSNTNTFTLPSTLDDIYIGDQTTYFSYGESIINNATILWKERLTDDQLEELTGEGFDTYELMAENLNYILQ